MNLFCVFGICDRQDTSPELLHIFTRMTLFLGVDSLHNIGNFITIFSLIQGTTAFLLKVYLLNLEMIMGMGFLMRLGIL